MRIHLKANPRTARGAPCPAPAVVDSSFAPTATERRNDRPIRERSAARTSRTPSENVPTSSFRSAPSRHCRDPCVGLHFFCVGVTLPLRAKRGQQAWRQRRPRSRQRLKDEKIRMRRHLLDLSVQIRDATGQTSDQVRAYFHHCARGFDRCPITGCGNRLLDSHHPALDQFLIATAVLAEERAQPRRRNFL